VPGVKEWVHPTVRRGTVPALADGKADLLLYGIASSWACSPAGESLALVDPCKYCPAGGILPLTATTVTIQTFSHRRSSI